MKICFIAPKAYQLFNPKVRSTFGGSEVQLSLLSKEIAKYKNLDIHFMVADYGQEEAEEIDGVTICKSINFEKGMLAQFLSFFSNFRKINADIYIQRTLTPQSGLIALYCKLKKKHFIYMVANDGEVDRTHDIYKSIFGRILAYLNFKLATKIIVQNKYEIDYLKNKYSSNKLYLLKKGLEVQGLLEERKVYDAVWIGRCEKLKNPEVFLNVAVYFPIRKFIMVAPIATKKEDYFNYIFEKASKLENVEFLRFIEYNKINDILKRCKVFILTSDQEGDWPMTVLEAASCGLPIISYKLNYDLLIDKYEGGVFCNNNFDEMTNKLDEILSNKNLYNQMQINSYKYVKDNHDIKVNAKRFFEILNK